MSRTLKWNPSVLSFNGNAFPTFFGGFRSSFIVICSKFFERKWLAAFGKRSINLSNDLSLRVDVCVVVLCRVSHHNSMIKWIYVTFYKWATNELNLHSIELNANRYCMFGQGRIIVTNFPSMGLWTLGEIDSVSVLTRLNFHFTSW